MAIRKAAARPSQNRLVQRRRVRTVSTTSLNPSRLSFLSDANPASSLSSTSFTMSLTSIPRWSKYAALLLDSRVWPFTASVCRATVSLRFFSSSGTVAAIRAVFCKSGRASATGRMVSSWRSRWATMRPSVSARCFPNASSAGGRVRAERSSPRLATSCLRLAMSSLRLAFSSLSSLSSFSSSRISSRS